LSFPSSPRTSFSDRGDAREGPRHTPQHRVQALGGAGYTKDWPVERYYRDAKLLDIGAGTNEIRRMLIGREVIGL
jgi:isovaleryl-CoA dehydrogenase